MSNYSSIHSSILYDSVNKSEDSLDTTPWWKQTINKSQLILTVAGLLANFVTLITFHVNRNGFSKLTALLIKHQSFVDGLVCLYAVILLVQEPNWISGLGWLDHILCHVWNSQFLFWATVFLSIWNLTSIAAERYIAVCKPLKHAIFSQRKVYLSLLSSYFCAVFLNSVTLIQTKVENDQCLSEYLFEGDNYNKLYQAYTYIVFITQYAFPCAAFFLLYGSIILTLKRRNQSQVFTQSQFMLKATRKLTKTAMIVTAIFIISLGYDLWYYMLGYSGVIEYKLNTPLQKIGVWLSCFNSAVNPFVYGCMMPQFRKNVKKTFLPYCIKPSRMTQSVIYQITLTSASPGITSRTIPVQDSGVYHDHQSGGRGARLSDSRGDADC